MPPSGNNFPTNKITKLLQVIDLVLLYLLNLQVSSLHKTPSIPKKQKWMDGVLWLGFFPPQDPSSIPKNQKGMDGVLWLGKRGGLVEGTYLYTFQQLVSAYSCAQKLKKIHFFLLFSKWIEQKLNMLIIGHTKNLSGISSQSQYKRRYWRFYTFALGWR